MQLHAQLFAFLISHHREIEIDVCDSGEGGNGALDAIGDFVAQRATGHSESNQNRDVSAINLYISKHAEVDN